MFEKTTPSIYFGGLMNKFTEDMKSNGYAELKYTEDKSLFCKLDNEYAIKGTLETLNR